MGELTDYLAIIYNKVDVQTSKLVNNDTRHGENGANVTRTCPLSLLVSKFPFYEQARQAIPDEREWDVRKTQEEDMNEGTGTCFIND